MMFLVLNPKGHMVYSGGSWPMARAALDKLILADEGCPRLAITPEPQPKKEP